MDKSTSEAPVTTTPEPTPLPRTTITSSKKIHLPDELWLQILSHHPPSKTWSILRHVNRQLHSCVETYATTTLLPDFTLGLVYSLGAGSSHRWYDIRATVTLSFRGLNRLNPQFARFEIEGVHPESTGERAREKWRRLCREGFGPEVEWRVRFEPGMGERKRRRGKQGGGGSGANGGLPWRVLLGIDDAADFGVMVKMRQLVVGEDDALWVDWRELLGRYFRMEESRRQADEILTGSS